MSRQGPPFRPRGPRASLVARWQGPRGRRARVLDVGVRASRPAGREPQAGRARVHRAEKSRRTLKNSRLGSAPGAKARLRRNRSPQQAEQRTLDHRRFPAQTELPRYPAGFSRETPGMRNEQRARRLPGGPGRSSASGASRGRKGRTERRDRAPPPSRRPIPAGPAPGRRGSTRASGARGAGKSRGPWAECHFR